MKKRAKSVPKVDPFIEGLMAKLLDRLTQIEKKMDKLMSQSHSHGTSTEPKPQPRHERMLYEAICADCHKVCEVPFQPTESRPVYCKECWAKRKGGNGRRPSGMPVLTPVALSPKPVGKLHQPVLSAVPAAKKAKKTAPKKKSKKR